MGPGSGNRQMTTTAMRQIEELFPDLRSIGDGDLRDRVAVVWDEAISTGCGGKGWSVDELRAIPFTLLAGDIDMAFVEHLNSCVKQCIAIEKVLKEVFGDRVRSEERRVGDGCRFGGVRNLLE